MWNNLLKLSVLSFIWKRYRKTIVLLPLLLLYFWVVGLIHNDYLAYLELQETNQGVGLSFVVKWLMLFVGVIGFIAAHIYGRSTHNLVSEEVSSSFFKRTKKPEQTVESSPLSPLTTATTSTSNEQHDGFDKLRKKHKLRSKADVILSKSDS